MRNNGLIIGISGKKRSGKDELGKYIQEWNKTFVVKKFADKIKDMICVLLNCTREQLEDEEWRTTPLDESWWLYTDGCHQEAYLGGNMKMLDGYNTLVKQTSPRTLMQDLGTNCGRDILHPNIWVNATFRDYTKKVRQFDEFSDGGPMMTSMYPNWVITDVRFPNEVEAIESRGGFVIRVERPSIISTDTHASETSLDDWAFPNKIINDSTLEALKFELEKILLQWRIKRIHEITT